jgi:hypothetical protein
MNNISIQSVKSAYITGEIIKGIVRLKLDKTVKARAVKLEIFGLEETRIYRRGMYSDTRSIKISYTYHDKNYFLKSYIILHCPQYDNDLELGPGNYAFRFEYKIPENALPSYMGRNASVSYKLVARVDVPWWLDVVEKRSIFVFRNREDLKSLTVPVKFTSDNFMDGISKKPCFGVELSKAGFLVGETIEGKVFLYNIADSKLRKIYVRLLGEELATAEGQQETKINYKQEIEIPVDDIMEGIAKVFFLQIPKNAPSNYEGLISNFSWGVEVGLDIPFGFDVKAFYPIEVLH